MSQYAHPEVLVDTQWLADHLHEFFGIFSLIYSYLICELILLQLQWRNCYLVLALHLKQW